MYGVLGFFTIALIAGFILRELFQPAGEDFSIPVTEEEVVEQLISRDPA
jgi:hypothetical protein